LVPSVVPLLASLLAVVVAKTLLDVPVSMGGAPVWPELPGTVVALYYLVQFARLLLWQRGHADSCYVCGCLLGRERQGRWGAYRRCLGCSKNHSI
jgi:hypothetical protein